jgi:hypothetical protein
LDVTKIKLKDLKRKEDNKTKTIEVAEHSKGLKQVLLYKVKENVIEVKFKSLVD